MIVSSSTTGGTVWQGWNNLYYNTTSSSSITVTGTSSNVWQQWNNAVSFSVTAVTHITNGTVWESWIETQDATGSTTRIVDRSAPHRRPSPPPQLTPEQLRDRDHEFAIYEDRAREQEKVLVAAQKRAEALLRQNLSDDQIRMYEKDRAFFVKSQSGRLYKVRRGKTHNIIMVDPVSKQELLEMCVTADNHHIYPDEDVMLAQKLLLEHKEEEALKKANIWDLRQNRRFLTTQEKDRLAAA